MKIPFLKKKKVEPEPISDMPRDMRGPPPIPEDLERFRPRREMPEMPEPIGRPMREPEEFPPYPGATAPPIGVPPKPAEIVKRESRNLDDKIDLILQKLETVDARLRLLEERTK